MKKETQITIKIEQAEIEGLIINHLIKKGEIPSDREHSISFKSFDYGDHEYIEATLVFVQ